MISNQEMTAIIEKVKLMKVEMPEKLPEYHQCILKIHENLNELTDLKLSVAHEMMSNKDKEEYYNDLNFLIKEIINPMMRQLTMGKQMFNMIIQKGKIFQDYGDPPPSKPVVEDKVSDMPGQEDIEKAKTSEDPSIDELVAMAADISGDKKKKVLDKKVKKKDNDLDAELSAALS